MNVGRLDRGAIGSAAVVAFLTLVVFFILRGYGPESAIRRFHSASFQGNTQELYSVVTDPFDPRIPPVNDPVRLLEARASAYVRLGYRMQIRRVSKDASGKRAYVVVSYGESQLSVWVVDRVGDNWKINSTASLQATQNLMRM